MKLFLKFLANTLAAFLAAGILLSAAPAWAEVVNCTTGSTTTGSITINANVVTGHSACSGSVEIPSSVTSIGAQAFQEATSLTSVTFEAGSVLDTIGDYAFYRATSLAAIAIPNSVTSIGAAAFYQATSLAAITIPNSVTSIGIWAFQEATSLAAINIPNSVTSIGTGLFYGATSLAAITIPNSVTSIGAEAFRGATSLTSVTFEGNAPVPVGANAFTNVGSDAVANIGFAAAGFGELNTWEGLRLVRAPAVIATSSEIYNDDDGATIVLTSSDFKANGVLSLSDFTIDTTGTGLTAGSVSVNAGATEATIVFTGTALTEQVSLTAKESAFSVSPGSSINTLAVTISDRILPECPVSTAITVPCLDSGSITRSGSIGFRLLYSNNSGFDGASFNLKAEIETSSNVYAPVAEGDVVTDLVILYPTSSAVGGRLKTATWAMVGQKDFTYTKTIETVNGTEVVKITTSYEYVNFTNKDGCGFGIMAFGEGPQAACESVGVSGEYITSANRSIGFHGAGDFDWLTAETGADGGYLNYLGSSFMWGSTVDTPLRFQLVGPHHKSANANDLNTGFFQVYMPAELVNTVYGSDFDPDTDFSLTRQDVGVLTATLSGTANVNLTRPNGGDLLIDVPTHPFSAPVFTISSSPSPVAPAPYSGPLPTSYSDSKLSVGDELVVSGVRLGTVTSCTIDGVSAAISNQSSERFTITVPAGLQPGLKDLVITSSAGTLIVQDALTISAATNDSSEPALAVGAKGWTKKLNDSSAKIYAKDVVGAGKVQIFFNGKEIAWVRATSAADTKLRTAKGAHYLVRTVDLVQGRKNVLEVYVDGIRIKRVVYSY